MKELSRLENTVLLSLAVHEVILAIRVVQYHFFKSIRYDYDIYRYLFSKFSIFEEDYDIMT